MSAVYVAVGTVVAAGISAYSSNQAADTQANALNNSANLQEQNFNQLQANEAPFLASGKGATSQLNYLLGIGTPGQGGTDASSTAGGFGSLNAPFNADTFKTMSPAYQFDLQQGGQGVLNQDSSTQGAESGAALKDLMSFNSNYANNSFNNAFNQYQTQQNNTFTRLSNIAAMGANAGSNQATGASQFSSNIGNTMAASGAASAAGQIGVSNAVSSGLNSAAGAYGTSQALPWLLNGGGGGGAANGAAFGSNAAATGTDFANAGNAMQGSLNSFLAGGG